MNALVLRHVVMLHHIVILLVSDLVHCVLEVLRKILGKALLDERQVTRSIDTLLDWVRGFGDLSI